MLKLLFVDDEQGIRETIQMVFKNVPNYQLFLAESGKKAIEIANKEKPDLVVLDMLMPDMRGDQVFQQLKAIDPQINVIFLTGLDTERVAYQVKELGAQGFITKPFDVFKIQEMLQKLVPDLYHRHGFA
jgi:two-component system response regulator (stage 0 sporulation protein F)